MNAIDPYRAPESALADITTGAVVLASKGRRFATLLLDSIGLGLVQFMTGIVLALTIGVEATQNIGFGLNLLLSIGSGLGYYILFESVFQRTPAKFLLGTKVIDEHGGAPSFNQVLGRSLCRYIPFEAFSFLGEGPGWHDTIPKTRVVMAR